MRVDADQLTERIRSLSTDEILAIVNAPEDQCTADARQLARLEILRRAPASQDNAAKGMRDAQSPSGDSTAENVLNGQAHGTTTGLRSTLGPSVSALNRYRDAYRVANVIVGVGTTIKVMGAVLASILIAASLFMAVSSADHSASLATGSTILGFGAAVIIGAAFWILGIVISALGQLLFASLDSAVYQSPFLTDAQRAEVMSLNELVQRQIPLARAGAGSFSPEVLANGKIRCWKCGKANHATQDKCWDCYTKLYERPVADAK